MGGPGATYALSVDIEDLFYSVPHEELFGTVREAIDSYGVVSFKNGCLVTANSFMELLTCYLASTFVSFNTKTYIQKKNLYTEKLYTEKFCVRFILPVLTESFSKN